MNRFVKTWLLWLLVFALPAQAQISVAQLSCDIGHQRQTGGHTMKAGHASYAKATQRVKRPKAAFGQHGGKQVKKVAKAPIQEMEQSVCGPCVTCCGAFAALPYLSNTPALWDISRQYRTALPASHVGYIPEGLERPPRHHLS